jgi:hypothetical protein
MGKWVEGCGLGSSFSEYGPMGAFLNMMLIMNEALSSIKDGNLIS